MITAIFPAAGQSRRMNASKNKNFLLIDDKPILVHTLEKFSKVNEINKLIIAAAENEVNIVSDILKKADIKPFEVVIGGSERQYSIANALKVIPDDAEIILVHDAARPLIDVEVIDEIIETTKIYGGAIAVVPVKDTIKAVDKENFVVDTPARSTLVAVQTPQGFKREIILKAYKQAEIDNFLGTDDSSLVERIGVKVKIVMSDYQNIKITTPEDILIAKTFILKAREYSRL